MKDVNFDELERIELEAFADFFAAAPPSARRAHGIESFALGSTTCCLAHDVEPTTIFRRVVGLGIARPASRQAVDDAIYTMRGRGVAYAIPLSPHARPAELADWLVDRGFMQGYAWMKFARACDPAPMARSDLEIRVVGSELGDAFGEIVADVFGFPATVGPWAAALAGRRQWVITMAFADDIPVATGAVYSRGDYAWLGFGATLPAYRSRGAQNALLACRLAEAASAGAKIAVTETGERVPDRPSGSYRNILRMGFREAYLRPNFLSPPSR